MAAQTLSRRDILLLGGTAVAALAIPLSLTQFAHEDAAQIEASILSLLSDQPGAAEIGQLWRDKTNSSADAKAVAGRIAKRLRAFGWRPGANAEAAHKALAARVRRDFVEGDMIEIEGWQLSRTSAELCLLASLHLDPKSQTHA